MSVAVALSTLSVLAGLQSAQPPESFEFPAEFAPHEAVWLTWSREEFERGQAVTSTLEAMIGALHGWVPVKVCVESAEQEAEARISLQNSGLSLDGVAFVRVPHSNLWIRDSGPIFVRGDRGSLAIVDYGYSYYGEESCSNPAIAAVEGIDREIAEALGIPTIKSSIVSEGGSREVNGKGTLMLVEAVEQQRNPGLSLDEIAAEHKRVLGQRHVVWIAQGPMEDDKSSNGPLPDGTYTATITGGHIDEFARFADASTILLLEVSPEERDPVSVESRRRLEAARQRLEQARDQDGQPFRILRVPRVPVRSTVVPVPQEDEGFAKYYKGSVPGATIRRRLSASYLNFLVTNGVVLMPAYSRPGRDPLFEQRDEQAAEVLATAFPGRRIVRIDVEAVNRGGGGMHCISQQEP